MYVLIDTQPEHGSSAASQSSGKRGGSVDAGHRTVRSRAVRNRTVRNRTVRNRVVSSVRQVVRAKAFAVVAALVLLASSAGASLGASPAVDQEAVVRAVLFFSPSCPHCHQVMNEDLPPLQQRFGSQLQVLTVDITVPGGGALYEAAVTRFDIPQERLGVPTLIVGGVVLVGSAEIPDQLPSLVERLLASGGSDWPAIPGILEVVPAPAAGASPSVAPVAPTGSPLSTIAERVGRDPLGNTLAVGVLIGLLLSLAWVAAAVWRARSGVVAGAPSGWIPLIAGAGLAVAGYLSVVELTGSSAVCGPVGNCNIVHESEYARLLGLIPIGLLGCAGYGSILGAWLISRLVTGRSARMARGGLVAVAVAGTLFSVYLTFLEPFVIGATCAWCLVSALLMDAVLLLATASTQSPPPVARPGATKAPV